MDDSKWNQTQMALNYGLRYNQSDACRFMLMATAAVVALYFLYYYVFHVFLAD